jgi:hypothetical protein
MIDTVEFQNYRNGEFIQFCITIGNKCMELNPMALQIAPQVDDFRMLSQKMDQLYKPNIGSEMTPDIVIQDVRRDQAIVGIRTIADGYTHHFSADKKQAGEQILKAIDHYGTQIYLQNYAEESTSLRAVINDLENTVVLSQAVALLQASDWVQELKQANNLFQTLYEARINEATGKVTSLELLRIDTTASYRTLVNHINSHEVLHPTPELTLLVDRINQTILQYNQIASVHVNKGGKKEGDKEGPPTA